jgi:prophage regulatory protein
MQACSCWNLEWVVGAADVIVTASNAIRGITMLSDTILRLPAVRAATGLCRSTIYERISTGTFPKPIQLGGGSVGWLSSEIEAWIRQRVYESRKGGGASAVCASD